MDSCHKRYAPIKEAKNVEKLIDNNYAEDVVLLRESGVHTEDITNRVLLCVSSTESSTIEKELTINATVSQFSDIFSAPIITDAPQLDLDASFSSDVSMTDLIAPRITHQSPREVPSPMRRQFITLKGKRYTLIGRPIPNIIIGVAPHKRNSLIIYRLSFGLVMIIIIKRTVPVQRVLDEVRDVCHVING